MATPSDLALAACGFCYDWDTAKKVIVYILAKNASLLTMSPSQLAVSACGFCYDNDTWKKVVVYLLSTGGGGGGATCVTGGNSPPVGVPPCNYSVWIQGPGPNFGVWFGDTNGWSAVAAIAQGP